MDSFDVEEETYNECDRIIFELNEIGWDANYDLSGEFTGVWKKKRKRITRYKKIK